MSDMQEMIKEYKKELSAEKLEPIIKEIQNCDTIWSAYSPVTKGHYVDYVQGMPAGFLFSKKEYCEQFAGHMKESGVTVGTVECTKENRLAMFTDFYRSGLDAVILDNGQSYIVIEMNKLINEPDYSGLPADRRPVLNRALMCSATRFLECLASKSVTPDKELNMLVDLFHAKYLIPVEGEPDGNTVSIPGLQRSDGKKVVPFFTDTFEFRKFDKNNRYKLTQAGFEQIESLCRSGEQVAVNPFGFNLTLTAETCDAIRRASQVVPEPDSSDRAVIYTPDDIPMKLINNLCAVLSEIPEVQRGFIKGVRKKSGTSLMVVLDCGSVVKEEAKAVCAKAADAAKDVESDREIEYLPADTDLGKVGMDKIPPFFERISIDAEGDPDSPD